MQEGGEAQVRDEAEKHDCDTSGKDPEAIAAGVAGDEEMFCFGRGDAAESDEPKDEAAIISHEDGLHLQDADQDAGILGADMDVGAGQAA